MNYKCLLFCSIFSLTACSQRHQDNYDYVPIETFKIDTSTLKENTALQIVAISGGKGTDKDNIYYHQVIAIDKVTQDTINIFVPAYKIPGSPNSFYIIPTELNPNKGITTGRFENADSLTALFLNVTGKFDDVTQNSIDTSINYLSLSKPKFVVVNNSMDIFKRKYKTIIGVIEFDQDPR